jgi:hypothetical protein
VDARLIRTDPDAEDNPPLADLIKSCDLMCQLHRIAKRRQEDAGAEQHPFRPPSDPGQHHQRFMSRPIDERIADPDRIVTELLRPFGQFQQRPGGRSALHHAFARRKQISNFRRHPGSLPRVFVSSLFAHHHEVRNRSKRDRDEAS